MPNINLLNNTGKIFNEIDSTIELSKNELNALSDENVREDVLIIPFGGDNLLKIKTDLGNRYNIEKIEYYNSGGISAGINVEVSEDDNIYVSLDGVSLNDRTEFSFSGRARYVRVSHSVDGLVQNHSPEVIVVDSSSVDTDGSVLLNSSTINDVYYYNRDTFFGPGKSWFNEPFVSGTRGKKREFPNHSLFVCTSNSLEIIDLETMDLWMRFLTGTTMLGSSEPTRVFVINDKVFVAMKNEGLRIIDFGADTISKLDVTGNYLGNTVISSRNSPVVFSLKAVNSVYPTNILNNTIFGISGSLLEGVDYVGLATSSGVSLVVGGSFVSNSTDGTLPITSVDISSNGNLYWSGRLGTDGEVNFKNDIREVFLSGATTGSSFSREGFYNTLTSLKIISNFVNIISVK